MISESLDTNIFFVCLVLSLHKFLFSNRNCLQRTKPRWSINEFQSMEVQWKHFSIVYLSPVLDSIIGLVNVAECFVSRLDAQLKNINHSINSVELSKIPPWVVEVVELSWES